MSNGNGNGATGAETAGNGANGIAGWEFDTSGEWRAMIARAATDPGAPFDTAADLADLQKDSRADYERVIKALKDAGFDRVGRLENEVERLGKEFFDDDNGPSDEKVLLGIADKDCILLFHDKDRRTYADVRVTCGNRATMLLDGPDFKSWLAERFYVETERGLRPELRDLVVGTLKARALFSGPEYEVFIRVATFQKVRTDAGEVTTATFDTIFIDLCNDKYETVEIDEHGWKIAVDPPVRFRRSRNMLPLPYPMKGGSIDDLRRFISLEDEDDFRLLCSFIVDALRRNTAYAILLVTGQEGAAKTTLIRIVVMLIDPSKGADVSRLPENRREYAIRCTNSHLQAFDNISTMSTDQSDMLAATATGTGHRNRALYTDEDEWIYEGARPQAMNGIPDFATRPDLIDRVVALIARKLSTSEPEDIFWQRFETMRPRILGAVYDAMSLGLKQLPTVATKDLPRMAGFTRWGTACAPGFGWSEAEFRKAYDESRTGVLNKLIDEDSLANAIGELLATRKEWRGTASELLKQLNADAEPSTRRENGWPKSPNHLSGMLKRLSGTLPKVTRISIDLGNRKGHRGDRMIHIMRAADDADDADDGTSSASSRGKQKQKRHADDADDGSPKKSAGRKRTYTPKAGLSKETRGKPLKRKAF